MASEMPLFNPGRSIDFAVALLKLGNRFPPGPLMVLRRLQADYLKKKGNPEMTILYHLGLIEIDSTNHNAPDKIGTLKAGDR